ncbi:MAG: heparinase II/III-family protein, partial [Verrucomicrobiota bacterium]|nr:heparinase II/III-family protein [Verrucomicrobiota bacterium]
MGDFIRDITKPDGTIVQFGDNDSGRFLKIFPDLDERNHQYLIRSIRNCHGLNSVIRAQLERHTETSVPFAHYTDFGLSIHRRGPWYLAMRCGSIGQKGNGGHAHHDQLSFELAVRGVSMIIDPGTYVYTPWPEERRRFRSTSMHNTL